VIVVNLRCGSGFGARFRRLTVAVVVSVALLGCEDNPVSQCLKLLEGVDAKSLSDVGKSGEKVKEECTQSLGEDANLTQIEQCVCNEVAKEAGDYQKEFIDAGICDEV